MKWKKLGRVFNADRNSSWMCSHAAVPIPLALGEDQYRIYFATRNANNNPSVASLEIDIRSPLSPYNISRTPLLSAGPLGYFDDNGVYPGCIIKADDELRMYYLGRVNGVPPLFYMSIGLAGSIDGGRSFTKKMRSPLLGRNEVDPWMVSTPFVLREVQGYRMWYLSGIGWSSDIPPQSSYHIKYAESEDGLTWNRTGKVCIELEPNESNIASPCVVRIREKYHMWYCFVRDCRYELGYAISNDGIKWSRNDENVGISRSVTGWDSREMAYPYVFKHQEDFYLLYTGNNLGQEGFGIAVLDKEGQEL